MFTNKKNIPLALQVMLATDNYDHNSDPKTISVTSILRPLRSLVLKSSQRSEPVKDIFMNIASVVGTAIHNALEEAWESPEEALETLGITDFDKHIVLTEIRSERVIAGWTVSGKFDICIDGQVQDLKNVNCYAYSKLENREKFILQLSIYKWLNPKDISDDFGVILYHHPDWTSLGKVKQPDSYPPAKMHGEKVLLLSSSEVETYLTKRLGALTAIKEGSTHLPECTPQELWQRDTIYKYYKNPLKKGKSTRTSTSSALVYDAYTKDFCVGEVVEIKGKVMACNYCDVSNCCSQKDTIEKAGLLAELP